MKRAVLLLVTTALLALPATAAAHSVTESEARAAAQRHADGLAGRSADIYAVSRTGIFRPGHAHSYYAQASWVVPSDDPLALTRYCFVEMDIRITASGRPRVDSGQATCSPNEDTKPENPTADDSA
jgi:hypothetical protein